MKVVAVYCFCTISDHRVTQISRVTVIDLSYSSLRRTSHYGLMFLTIRTNTLQNIRRNSQLILSSYFVSILLSRRPCSLCENWKCRRNSHYNQYSLCKLISTCSSLMISSSLANDISRISNSSWRTNCSLCENWKCCQIFPLKSVWFCKMIIFHWSILFSCISMGAGREIWYFFLNFNKKHVFIIEHVYVLLEATMLSAPQRYP